MGLPVEINNLMMGAVGGYQVGRSLRFRSSASAYLSRTMGSPSRTTATISAWVKRGNLTSSYGPLYFATNWNSGVNFEGSGGAVPDSIQILDASNSAGSAYYVDIRTSQVFRDPSSWYHLVITYDTTNATSSDRIRLYVNGVRVTAFQTATYPAQNQQLNLFSVSEPWRIGSRGWGSTFFLDGYLSEFNYIDGQALTASSFGATDVNGIWQPKKYTGTYGTNGFYLPFSDTSSTTNLVKDSSGNANNWTPNNISLTAGTTYDSMLDAPTNNSPTVGNFAVLNPLSLGSTVTLSNGNLTMTEVGTFATTVSSIAMKSGKWYAEMTVGSNTYAGTVGIAKLGYASTSRLGFQANTWSYNYDGGLYYNSITLAGNSTFTTGDVIGITFDADALEIKFYKNGTLQTNYYTSANSGLTAGEFYFATGHINSTSNWNFGQRPFSYTPPTGFVALNTYNLPAPSIKVGAQHFAATTYTGNGTSQSINNAVNGISFQPDFVWYKDRSVARDHALFNVTSGATYLMSSNNTSAESAVAGTLTSFNSNGYSIGSAANANANGETYVGWQWKGGGTAVSNNSGTITSSVSANASAGFSVVTATAPASGGFTVGHGLGVVPAMIIVKDRSAVVSWTVGHKALPNQSTYYLSLNQTIAQQNNTTVWNNTAPTSSVVSLGVGGAMNASDNFVMYCFSEVSGYSAFGSYNGTGSTDGAFVYTGFRPRWIMMKCSSSAGLDWNIVDTSRNTYNVTTSRLWADLSNAEDSTDNVCDILSNGFKLRSTNTNTNQSGGTFIYAAFAEVPFQLARGR